MLPLEREDVLSIHRTFDAKPGTGGGYEFSIRVGVLTSKLMVEVRDVKIKMQLILKTVKGMQHCQ